MQQWFTLSDPAMREALYDTPLCCELARLDPEMRIPVNVTDDSGIVTGIPMNVTAGWCCAI